MLYTDAHLFIENIFL